MGSPDDFTEYETEYVELCHGRTRKGREFHAFIKMTFGQYAHYKHLIETGAPINLREIGKIVHVGWGKEPPAETAQRILREHTDNLKILESLARQQRDINEIIRTQSNESTPPDIL